MPLTIFNSSAGSGKTETLAREYLKIVLNDPDEFKSILAVTFTNKAAGEMRDRIIKRLVQLSQRSNPELEKYLKKAGVKTNISEQAKAVLQLILHNYSFFSVCTIDSFFHKIFRSFARELKQKLGFEVMLEEKEALARAVDDLFADIGTDPKLTEYLRDFAFYNIDEDSGWGIDSRIKKQAEEIFRERYRQRRDKGLSIDKKTVQQILSHLFDVIRNFEIQLQKLAGQALQILDQHGLTSGDFKSGIINEFRRLSNPANYPNQKELGANFASAVQQNIWCTKNSPKKDQVTACVKAGLGEISKRIFDTICGEEGRTYSTAVHLVKTIHTLGLFGDLQNKLKSYRDENHVVFISDINDMIQSIVKDNPAPFLYETVGLRYMHFLIDEFQDTSAVQWNNLLPLIKNSLAGGGSSIIVGDVKQSIFRWRNGNMRLLLEKVDKDLNEFKDNIHHQNLTTNRRSRRNIIEFNNKFFLRMVDSTKEKLNGGRYSILLDHVYREVKQGTQAAEKGGYVRIEFVEKDSQPTEDRLLRTITQLVNDQKFPYSQITILVRWNFESRKVAALLNQNDIPVISAESLLVESSPQVKFLLSILRWLVNPRDVLAHKEAEYQYYTYLSPQAHLPSEARSSFNPLLLNQKIELLAHKERYLFLSLTLYDVVETIVRKFGLNRSPNSYLLKFLQIVLDFSVRYSTGIRDFLQWWDQADRTGEKFSIVVPEQENAVRLMTIHKAKGLENQVIIIPYANWDFGFSRSKQTLMWVESAPSPFTKSEAYLVNANGNLKGTYFEDQFLEEKVLTHIDNLNLLYVAFTRPIQQLYVIVPGGGIGSLIKETLELEPELSAKFDIQHGVFQWGEAQLVQSDAASPCPDHLPLEITQFVSEDVKSKALLKKSPTPLAVFSPEKIDEDTPDGKVFHYAMSLVETAADLENVMQVLVDKGIITPAAAPALKQLISRILSLPETADWFSGKWRVMKEAEILTPHGEIKRPDRVMFRDSKTIIIDYKTGSQKDEHKRQINQYADLLKQAGYTNVEKYLIYAREGKVLKL